MPDRDEGDQSQATPAEDERTTNPDERDRQSREPDAPSPDRYVPL
ncbi:hypothetical protein [Hamadaea sp.]|nr:hypothetical protein [Hamadaea sp.]